MFMKKITIKVAYFPFNVGNEFFLYSFKSNYFEPFFIRSIKFLSLNQLHSVWVTVELPWSFPWIVFLAELLRFDEALGKRSAFSIPLTSKCFFFK